MLKPLGSKANEIVQKDTLNYLSYPDKELFLCFLPEMTGQDENMLINSVNNFLIMIYPMGEEFSERISSSKGIIERMERRHSKLILYDDEMKKFPYYSFLKLIEIREHIIYLIHWAYVQKSELFLGRDAMGASYSKIKYDPLTTVENIRSSPWYKDGMEEIFSFSKFEIGNKINPDLNEILVVTFRE